MALEIRLEMNGTRWENGGKEKIRDGEDIKDKRERENWVRKWERRAGTNNNINR